MKECLENFLNHYLVERDLEATLSCLTENIISIGTGEHETARNKTELRKLMEAEFASLASPFEYRLLDYTESMETENAKDFFSNIQIRLIVEDEPIEMIPRLTGTMIKCEGEWKLSCLHMSMPSVDQEKNTFFPLHFGSDTRGELSEVSEMKLMELVIHTLPGGIMGGYLEEGFPLYTINDKMLEILGYTYEELLAETDEKMMNMIYEEDQERVHQEILKQFAKKGEYEIQYRAVGKGGRIIWINDIGKEITAENGRKAMLSIMTDITEQIKREQNLLEEASHDSLTHLYNRKMAQTLIEEQFADGRGGMLFICDIDHFKQVNDTRGHVFGDAVLEQLAAIMKKCAGGHAIIGRLGGDEYVLYFPAKVETEKALEIMKNIQEKFRMRMKRIIPELNISMSAGGTIRNEENLQLLYNRADRALYQAKQTRGEIRIL